MARTDIHRPGSADFDPESYNCFGVFDLDPEWGGSRERIAVVNSLLEEGYSFKGAPHGSHQCSHCGVGIRYAALMGHEPTKTLMYIGETCLDNRFEMTKAEFQALRKTASLNRDRMARKHKMAAFIEEHPMVVWASYAHNIEVVGGEVYWIADWNGEQEFATREEAEAEIATWETWQQENTEGPLMGYRRGTTWVEKTLQGKNMSTLADMWSRFERYGEMSDNAYVYLVRILGWIEEAEERLAKREAEQQAKVEAGVQVPSGRVVVEGTIKSIKWKSSDFGGTWKITVEGDEGWKIWGSLPSSLEEWDQAQEMVGKRVRFTATVEAKADDQTFGFFKRPAKAEVLG